MASHDLLDDGRGGVIIVLSQLEKTGPMPAITHGCCDSTSRTSMAIDSASGTTSNSAAGEAAVPFIAWCTLWCALLFPVAALSAAGGGHRQGATAVTTDQRKAIDAYARELDRLRNAHDTSLENLLAAADLVEKLLMNRTAPEDRPQPAVDELPAEEVKRIGDRLMGLDIHIGDTVSVAPDPSFLLGLAKTHGRGVDVEFFALLNRAYPVSAWPVWVERTGPESGCVDFTSGELVDLYAAWRRFESSHPGSYRAAVVKELGAMEEDLLADGRRLCPQDRTLVARELRRLLTQFPADPIAAKIRSRLAAATR